MKTVALIPIRAGSKGIPGKNMKDMCGKPLAEWVVDAALKAESIDEVWVSTDSEEYWEHFDNHAIEYRVKDGAVVGGMSDALLRPDWLATDTATSDDVLRHFCWARCDPEDHVVMLQATSPLTTSDDIDGAVCVLTNIVGLTGCAIRDRTVVSVVEMPTRMYWTDCHPNYNPFNRPMRDRVPETYMENGAIYCSGVRRILSGGARITDYANPYIMPPETATEIDTPEDWDIVEKLLEARLS